MSTPAAPSRAAPSRAAPSEDLLGKALDRTLLRRIFAQVWPYRAELAVAVSLLPIISLFEIAQPYLLKKAIDEHIAVSRLAGLDRLGFLYLGALIGQYGLGFVQLYLTQLVGQRGMNDLRVRAHRHVLSLSASFFDRTPVGRLMTRLTSDIEALNEMFASGIVSLVGEARCEPPAEAATAAAAARIANRTSAAPVRLTKTSSQVRTSLTFRTRPEP